MRVFGPVFVLVMFIVGVAVAVVQWVMQVIMDMAL